MDDLQRRSLPAAARSLHRHGLLDARHGRREKHCRQRHPTVQTTARPECGRPRPSVQHSCQTLARENCRCQPRLLLYGQRHHGPRMPVPARQGTGRGHSQRFRRRFRLAGRHVRPQAGRSAQALDFGSRSLPRSYIRPRTADCGNERSLRIPQQRHRRISGIAETACVRTAGAGNTRLHHGSGRQQRPAQGARRPSCRPVGTGRNGFPALCDASSDIPRMGPHRTLRRRQQPHGGRESRKTHLRTVVSRRTGRYLQCGLLRTAGGDGRNGFRILLRTVGLHAAGERRLLGTHHHDFAGGFRTLGGRPPAADAGGNGHPTHRRQRCRSHRRNRPRHRGIRRHGCGAIRGREALGLRNGTDGPVAKSRSLLLAGIRQSPPCGRRAQQAYRLRQRRPHRTGQFRQAAARKQPPDLDAAHRGGLPARKAPSA